MGFELPNGKTARNIQDQVKFLTEKVKELIARVNELELHIEIVDELPEKGSSDIIYFVPVEDPEQGNYYNEYMWIDDAWELIGTTQIDLSGYLDLASAQTITGEKTISDTAAANSPKLKFQNEYITLGLWANGYQLKTDGPFNAEGNISTEADLYVKGGTNIRATNAVANYKICSDNGYYLDFIFTRDGYTSEGSALSILYGSKLSTKSINPQENNTYDLGETGQYETRWRNLFISGKVDFGNDAYITKDQYNRITLNVSNNAKIVVDAGQTYVNNNLLPLTPTRDLGSNEYPWKDLHISGNLTDGTNTVSVAQIASGIGGTYRHVIYIEGATADINIAVNLNSATPITTQAALAAINGNVMGGTATLDEQSTYRIVAIDSVGTVGSITYLDETGQHTLNIVDIYQDVVNQL